MRPLKLIPDNTNIPFLEWRNIALVFSVLLLAGSIFLVATRGVNLGVDFTGGQQFRVTFAAPAQVDRLDSTVSNLGLGDASIQQFADPKKVAIRMRLPEGDKEATDAAVAKVRAAISGQFPDARFDNVEAVSGKVSQELFRAGALALSLAMLGIALYIWFRFEWQFGVGALVTIFHDVVLTFGFFSLTQLEFDLNVVAAILTIIGYSLNDTIVIYDRIRENLRKWRKMEIAPLIDLSINETLSRTTVTSLSLILTLGVLLALGPDVIFGFTLAMLLGIGIGTFSSFYISSPMLVWLKVGPNSFMPKVDARGSAERVAPPEGFVK
jgi:preprotein translocase subunit SecF